MRRSIGQRATRVVMAGALGLTALSSATAQPVGGRIVSAGDRPVEHARIEVEAGGVHVFSDRLGFFELRDVGLPGTLVVGHPRFETRRVPVSEPAADLEIVLVPRQEVFETIAVSANRGDENFAPVSVAASVIEPATAPAPATSVTELLAGTASVAENGQGGIFQTYSIRGVSRQRVLTLVGGMRIVGERRAGVSASFADPLLLGSIDVVRGPSSTYYGSGALGGVVQLFPRSFDGASVVTGFESQGSERWALVADGGERGSWGLAYRNAGQAETARGATLDSGFSQLAVSFERRWQVQGLDIDLGVLASAGRDIGKASTDWPERRTVYPREQHVVARVGVSKAAVWDLAIAIHPNNLQTEVTQTTQKNAVANDAFDLGVSWQRRFRVSKPGSLRFGIDYFGRRGVEAREEITDLATPVAAVNLVQKTLSNGSEDELGVFGAWERNLGRSVLVAGGRLAWQRQDNAGSASTEDRAATAFAGLVMPVGGGFEVVANVGTGLRFPSLSERYFSGTTGRGLVVGSRDLDPERSLNLDAGLRYYGERLYVSGYLFRNEIDDYIERIEIAPDRLTFANLTAGTIEGIELDGAVALDAGWSLSFGGHSLEGRDQLGLPLADVPADRVLFGARLERPRWRFDIRWEARSAKRDPGSGEKVIPAVDLVTSGLDVKVRPGLELQLALRNVLDESYFNSADRKVPEAPGRSLALSLRWSGSKPQANPSR